MKTKSEKHNRRKNIQKEILHGREE